MVIELVRHLVEVTHATKVLLACQLVGVLALLKALLSIWLISSKIKILLLFKDLVTSILESLIGFEYISIVLITLHR